MLYAGPMLRNNEAFLIEAICINPLSLMIASGEKLDSKTFILRALPHNGLALQFAKTAFKSDQEIVLAALHQNPLALKYASKDLQKDPCLLEKLLAQDPKHSLAKIPDEFFSPFIKKDLLAIFKHQKIGPLRVIVGEKHWKEFVEPLLINKNHTQEPYLDDMQWKIVSELTLQNALKLREVAKESIHSTLDKLLNPDTSPKTKTGAHSMFQDKPTRQANASQKKR